MLIPLGLQQLLQVHQVITLAVAVVVQMTIEVQVPVAQVVAALEEFMLRLVELAHQTQVAVVAVVVTVAVVQEAPVALEVLE
jgi:hypothetical protein